MKILISGWPSDSEPIIWNASESVDLTTLSNLVLIYTRSPLDPLPSPSGITPAQRHRPQSLEHLATDVPVPPPPCVATHPPIAVILPLPLLPQWRRRRAVRSIPALEHEPDQPRCKVGDERACRRGQLDKHHRWGLGVQLEGQVDVAMVAVPGTEEGPRNARPEARRLLPDAACRREERSDSWESRHRRLGRRPSLCGGDRIVVVIKRLLTKTEWWTLELSRHLLVIHPLSWSSAMDFCR